MTGYFLLKKGPTGKYSFDLRDGNHGVLLTSENYPSKDAAVDAIAAVQKCAAEDARFVRLKEDDGHAYFLLKSGSAQVIGRSDIYPTTSAMEHGIMSVKALGGATEVRDLA